MILHNRQIASRVTGSSTQQGKPCLLRPEGQVEGGMQRADSALTGDDVGIDDISVEARGLD
jgi:hypothetical protein